MTWKHLAEAIRICATFLKMESDYQEKSVSVISPLSFCHFVSESSLIGQDMAPLFVNGQMQL